MNILHVNGKIISVLLIPYLFLVIIEYFRSETPETLKIQTEAEKSYSAFENFGPTTSIWSFLEIFRINFGQKIEIFVLLIFERTVQFQAACETGESRGFRR